MRPFRREHIFPNLYIILVAPAGARKAAPIADASELYSRLGLPTLGDKPTPEWCRQKMSNLREETATPYKPPETEVYGMDTELIGGGSIGAVFLEELYGFLGEHRTDWLNDLCVWWDCKKHWDRPTKTGGVDILDFICFNILGATAPDWLPNMLPRSAVGGGFTSRCVILVVKEMGQPIPCPEMPPEEDWEHLVTDLQAISKMRGLYVRSKEVTALYRPWYIGFRERQAAGELPPGLEAPMLASYVNRRAVILHKLMMVAAASRNQRHTIEVPDYEKALGWMEEAEANMRLAFEDMGLAGDIVGVENRMAEWIERQGVTTYQALFQAFWHETGSSGAFDERLESLHRRGLIRVEADCANISRKGITWRGK